MDQVLSCGVRPVSALSSALRQGKFLPEGHHKMGWQDLLASGGDRVLPWLGGRQIHNKDRTWAIQGRLPPEFGWYTFDTSSGRRARLKGEAECDLSYEDGQQLVRGVLIGDRIIRDNARVDPDPDKLIEQTEPVFCVERGLDRFTRAVAVQDKEGRLVYMRMEWPTGPEADVLAAFQDRKDSVSDIPNVTPPLDLAFRWISYQRAEAEARVAELERLRKEEEAKLAEAERVRRLMKQTGTAEGRRALAVQDFPAAARAALLVAGAELLDVRDGRNRGEKVVQYRFRNRRLECVVDARTMRILDSGVCLNDHRGTKGDTWFTLESLPGVIGEAIDRHKLVVYHHVLGDQDYPDYDDDGDDW